MKITVKITLLVLCIPLSLLLFTAAGTEGRRIPVGEIDGWVRGQVQEQLGDRAVEPKEAEGPYAVYWQAAATERQKEALAELQKDRRGFTYPRKAMEIVGQIEPDAPRVTLEDGLSALREGLGYSEIIARFNAIAGAPDFMGGSGMDRALYCLDNTGEKSISVFSDGGMMYNDGTESKVLGEEPRPGGASSQAIHW